ncbi:hypothetical protein fugu_011803 [Takifugu bimaculatus]|uniref:Leucine-rich repeat-containing protein 56 n=1 Tax=Takifugu bimaculatus TaxID=433685 RepID=A0A4Z2C8I7_9TELE|nr:hypothetical protein fugu_011803 [Takifugu bimaculatus]
MSSCYERVLREVRPLTARAMVAELSGPIQPTPVPVPCDIYESDVELLYLSRKKLEQLCGTEDLSHVTLLQICVDTQENTLGNFGVYLPKLLQLRMNNSVIKSMRDLGTALYHLQVLWMTRCSLRDLSGVSNFSSLKELYLAYNSISELSQVGMLENLQLLDLEGNDVDDLVQVQYLGLCGKLQTLILEGNPVCARPNPTATQTAGYSYRAAVRELVPQLCYLDNLSLEESERHSSSTMGEDWVVLQTAIKDSKFLRAAAVGDETMEISYPGSRGLSAGHLFSPSFVWPHHSADSRPTTGSRPSSAIRPGPLPPNGPKPGAGNTKLCGNPVRALRARREKLRTAPSRSMFSPRDLPIHIPEHTYDIEELDGERDDVLAELRAWREQHSRRVESIKAERAPQILTIQHKNEEEETDCFEDEFPAVMDENSGEESEEKKQSNTEETSSPDSCFEFRSLDLRHKVAALPAITQRSQSGETVLCPSPPLSTSRATGNRKQSGFREHRLRPGLKTSLPDIKGVGHFSETVKASEVPDLKRQQFQKLPRISVPCQTLPALIPHPPLTRRADMVLSSSAQTRLPTTEIANILASPAVTRPRTARAALQKHHLHRSLQPCRGSPQTNTH